MIRHNSADLSMKARRPSSKSRHALSIKKKKHVNSIPPSLAPGSEKDKSPACRKSHQKKPSRSIISGVVRKACDFCMCVSVLLYLEQLLIVKQPQKFETRSCVIFSLTRTPNDIISSIKAGFSSVKQKVIPILLKH